MIGRPPRTRQERGTVQKLTEEQLREELEQQARIKKQEKRAQQFKEKEQNLAQLEQAGHDLHQYKEKVYQEYQDVLPVQSKAEQERLARIKLREEERLRRQNGLGSAYEQQKQTLPFQIEKQLKENLNRQNFDWIDQQAHQEQRQTIEQQNRSQYDQRQSEIRSPQYDQRQEQRPYGSPPQPPSYVDNRQQQLFVDSRQQPPSYVDGRQQPQSHIENRQQAPSYIDNRQQMDLRQEHQYQQPISQQSTRSKPSQEVDFYSRFGQPQSQQSQRGQAIDQNSSNNFAMNQKLKYREELDKQIQEKKMREQQEKEQYQQRPSSQKVIDYQDNGIQSPQQNQQVYQMQQMQQIPQQESRRFNTERRFTSGAVDDVDKKNKQYEYAEELKRQMEEKQIRKKQLEEEEKRRQLIEKQKFEQEVLLQEQLKKQEEKKKQIQIFEHQVHNKQLAKRVQNDHQQDILKKSGSQVIQQLKYEEPPKQIKNEEPKINQKVDTAQSQFYEQNNNPHFQQQQYQQQYQPQYQQPQQQFQQQQYYQQPAFQQYQPQQIIDYRQMDQVQKFQQILFTDQPQQNQQNMMVHQQYLYQLQQNRKEIETVKQILEEKLRIQQLEMQNQLIIDQYQRKVYDIQKEQKMFEQEIQKLQDYIKGKQRKPLDPQIFASALFYSSIGQQDPMTHHMIYGIQKPFQPSHQSQRQHSPLQQFANQQNHFQEIPKEMVDRSPNKTQKTNQAQTIQQTFKANYTPITESMIDNDIELPAQSEYVNIEELKIGLEKSFISDFQAFKQTKKENHNNTKQNVTESQKTDTKLNDYFISQSEQIQEDMNQKDFQEQLEQQDGGEKETSKSVIEKLEELLNVDEQISAQEDFQEDQEIEDEEQAQSGYEEEQLDEDQVDDEVQEEDQDGEEQQDDLQEEKQDNFEQLQSQVQPHRTDAFEDNPEALRTNWEYQTLFRDNIKSQSKKYELRVPTGLLQQNTLKLTQHDQFYQESVHESMIEQSNIIESECFQSHEQAREVQMSQAQFDNNEIHTVIPTEEEEFIPVQKQMELSKKSKQTPKVVNVFPFDQQRKNVSSVIQSKIPSQSNLPNQSKLPNQSSCINQNPLISDTMLTQYQPKTMGIRSRIESQLQKSEQQTFQQSERVENSLWKNDQNMFAYDQ